MDRKKSQDMNKSLNDNVVHKESVHKDSTVSIDDINVTKMDNTKHTADKVEEMNQENSSDATDGRKKSRKYSEGNKEEQEKLLGEENLENAQLEGMALSSSQKEVSVELNCIVNYLEATKFVSLNDPERKFWQSFSLNESKAWDVVEAEEGASTFIKLTQICLARVYPKASRIDSGNYDPIQFWLRGFQMAALNQQTQDEGTKLNSAFFAQNGGCGYVKKPEYMLKNPLIYSPISLTGESEESVSLYLLAGHNLGQGEVSVSLRLLGHPQDCTTWNSSTVSGPHPVWGEECVLTVRRPHLALLEVKVFSSNWDTPGNIVGDIYLALKLVQGGYRILPMKSEKGLLPPAVSFDITWRK